MALTKDFNIAPAAPQATALTMNDVGNGLTSLLHEGEQVIQEFLPLWIIADLVQLEKKETEHYFDEDDRELGSGKSLECFWIKMDNG